MEKAPRSEVHSPQTHLFFPSQCSTRKEPEESKRSTPPSQAYKILYNFGASLKVYVELLDQLGPLLIATRVAYA